MEPTEKTAKTASYSEPPTATPQVLAEPFRAFMAPERLVDFLDEERCRLWVLGRLCPAGARCPACEATVEKPASAERFWKGKKLHCQACGRWFTALSGTPLSGSKLSFNQIFLLVGLLEALDTGLTQADVARAIGVTQDTVRYWRAKFRLLKGE